MEKASVCQLALNLCCVRVVVVVVVVAAAVVVVVVMVMVMVTPGGSAADGYSRHGQDLVPQAHVLQVPVEPDAAHSILPQGGIFSSLAMW